jgi:hypothetical protein
LKIHGRSPMRGRENGPAAAVAGSFNHCPRASWNDACCGECVLGSCHAAAALTWYVPVLPPVDGPRNHDGLQQKQWATRVASRQTPTPPLLQGLQRLPNGQDNDRGW